MEKPFGRVLLHIGPPKTGTTSIQHFLFGNRPALEARGFYVPLASSRGFQHIELPLCFRPHSKNLERLTGVDGGEIDARRETMTNAFAAEMASVSGGDTMLISSEHLFGGAPSVIEAYKRFFAPYAERFESLMYLRRQDRWIASSVLQRRKSGVRSDMGLVLGPDTGFVSPQAFERAVRLWDAGSDHCHIRRFDPEFLFRGSLLEDFCNVIGCDEAGLTMHDAYNRAPLQEQIELTDALGNALANVPFDKQTAYRSRFQPFCTEVLGGSPFEFPRVQAQAAFEAYAPINGWLRETRDPSGPRFFFNEDFSDYPIEARNDRTYALEELHRLSAAIGEQLRALSLRVPVDAPGATREAVIAHIISSFIALHDAEIGQAREARRNAAIEERRRARLTGRTKAKDAGPPDHSL